MVIRPPCATGVRPGLREYWKVSVSCVHAQRASSRRPTTIPPVRSDEVVLGFPAAPLEPCKDWHGCTKLTRVLTECTGVALSCAVDLRRAGSRGERPSVGWEVVAESAAVVGACRSDGRLANAAAVDQLSRIAAAARVRQRERERARRGRQLANSRRRRLAGLTISRTTSGPDLKLSFQSASVGSDDVVVVAEERHLLLRPLAPSAAEDRSWLHQGPFTSRERPTAQPVSPTSLPLRSPASPLRMPLLSLARRLQR